MPSSTLQPLQTNRAVLRNSTPSPPPGSTYLYRLATAKPHSFMLSLPTYILPHSFFPPPLCSAKLIDRTDPPCPALLHRQSTGFLPGLLQPIIPTTAWPWTDPTRPDLTWWIKLRCLTSRTERLWSIAPLLTACRLSVQIHILLACVLSTKLPASVTAGSTPPTNSPDGH